MIIEQVLKYNYEFCKSHRSIHNELRTFCGDLKFCLSLILPSSATWDDVILKDVQRWLLFRYLILTKICHQFFDEHSLVLQNWSQPNRCFAETLSRGKNWNAELNLCCWRSESWTSHASNFLQRIMQRKTWIIMKKIWLQSYALLIDYQKACK